MKLQLLTQNSKIKSSGDGQSVVFNFGIPAFRSKTGEATCPNAGVCASGCYAKSGAYLFSNVAAKFESRFEATKDKDFGLMIQVDINKIKAKYLGKKRILIRIHDSGDFYSNDYVMKWLDIMYCNSEIEFYAYTKQVSLFKSIGRYLPDNFKLIFSFGGKEDHLIDTTKDRHSLVFETEDLLIKAGYSNASVNDLTALYINHRIGLVFHHAKNFSNTLWNKVNTQTKEVY